MRRYLTWILRHRLVVLGLCVVLTGLSCLSLSRVRMSTSLSRMFLGDTDDHQRYVERLRRYGGAEQLMVGFQQDDLGSTGELGRLARVVTALEEVAGVAQVYSILDAGSVVEDGMDSLLMNPLISGLLLSADGRHTTLIIEFEPDSVHTLEEAPATIERVVGVFEAADIDRSRLHFGGFIAMLAEINRQGRRNALWITPLVGAVLLLLIYLFFRRLWPVVLTGLVAFLAVTWTLGFASLIDPELNVLVAMAPAMILVISFADVVHLCSAYIKELAGGSDRDTAILASAGDVGTACVFTSLTTLVGFISIALIDIPALRMLGIIMGCGTAVALVLAMTLVPVVFSLMKPPEPWAYDDHRRTTLTLDHLLGRCEHLATTQPWAVIVVSVVISGVLIAGCMRIRIEADFVKRMSSNNPLRIDAAYFDQHFAGTVPLELFVTFTGDSAAGPAVLERLADYRRALENMDGIAKVVPPFGAQSIALSAAELTRFVDVERREVRMIALLHDTGVSAIYDIGERARELGATVLGSDMAVEPSGFFYLAGRWLDVHIISQKQALFMAFATIALMLVVLFRSLRIGLWSLLPNTLPVLAIGGVLGFGWPTADSDLIIVLLVAIGIAVDDTIHFLSRWRLELRRGTRPDQAVHCAFAYAGRAIVQTSVILAVGFAPMAFSGYLSFRMIGILMPIAVITALLADILLLPALIRVGALPAGQFARQRS